MKIKRDLKTIWRFIIMPQERAERGVRLLVYLGQIRKFGAPRRARGGALNAFRRWLKRLFCRHNIQRGPGLYYCTKCDWWEH